MEFQNFINEERLSQVTGKSKKTLQQDRWKGIGVHSETDVQNYLDGVRIETKAS